MDCSFEPTPSLLRGELNWPQSESKHFEYQSGDGVGVGVGVGVDAGVDVGLGDGLGESTSRPKYHTDLEGVNGLLVIWTVSNQFFPGAGCD